MRRNGGVCCVLKTYWVFHHTFCSRAFILYVRKLPPTLQSNISGLISAGGGPVWNICISSGFRHCFWYSVASDCHLISSDHYRSDQVVYCSSPIKLRPRLPWWALTYANIVKLRESIIGTENRRSIRGEARDKFITRAHMKLWISGLSSFALQNNAEYSTEEAKDIVYPKIIMTESVTIKRGRS